MCPFDLHDRVQSACHIWHSADTDILKVLSDILDAVVAGDLAALASFVPSAAFDTVDNIRSLLQLLRAAVGRRWASPLQHWSGSNRLAAHSHAPRRRVNCFGFYAESIRGDLRLDPSFSLLIMMSGMDDLRPPFFFRDSDLRVLTMVGHSQSLCSFS
jgi:hypothetical protein